MSRYPTLLLLLVVLLLASCDGGSQVEPPGSAAVSAATRAPRPPGFGARRPLKSFWVLNTNDQCLLYWTEADRQSEGKPVRCPRALTPGEKAELTGKTCMRHSSQPDRNVPIRCPKELFYAERDDRAREGEWNLPAASASRP